jgi:hypothetical protein
MHRLQELVRLHRLGLPERRAAKELRIGRNTAREYRAALAAAGILDGSASELPELEALKAIVLKALPARPAPQQVSTLDGWQSDVEALLEKRLGPQAIHDRLRLEHSDFKGSLGSLKRLVHRLCRARGVQATEVTIPVETEAGDVAQVDFGYAGKLWHALDICVTPKPHHVRGAPGACSAPSDGATQNGLARPPPARASEGARVRYALPNGASELGLYTTRARWPLISSSETRPLRAERISSASIARSLC